MGKALIARCLLELCPELTYPALYSQDLSSPLSLCPTKAPAASRPFLLLTRSPRPSSAQGGKLLLFSAMPPSARLVSLLVCLASFTVPRENVPFPRACCTYCHSCCPRGLSDRGQG